MVAGKDWPTHLDFQEALENTIVCFDDPGLKGGSIPRNALGFLRVSTGGFASVYQVESGGKKWAVRCFTSPIQVDTAKRYEAISAHLTKTRLPYTVDFAFDPRGVRVEGTLYPTVKMAWVPGETLSKTIVSLLAARDTAALTRLLKGWRRLCDDLYGAGVAHGDLQHGNILVTPDRQLKLVDYDGIFVPGLAGLRATELGQPSYQHPLRSKADFGLMLDRYAALVIYTAMAAIRVRPELWEQYDNEDNMLFTPDDHADPDGSPLFRDLVALGGTVGILAAELALAARQPLSTVPTIGEALTRSAPPVLPAPSRSALASRGASPEAWWKQAADAEPGGAAASQQESLPKVRPVWSRPGVAVVRWFEAEPVFGEVARTATVVTYPARRWFRKTAIQVPHVERAQIGSRQVPKERFEQLGSKAPPGLKSVAATAGLAYGLTQSAVLVWRLGGEDAAPVLIEALSDTVAVAAAGGTFAVATRAGLLLGRGTRVARKIGRVANAHFYAVAVSPDGRLVAAGLGQDKAAVVYEAGSGTQLLRLDGFRRMVQAVAFVGDNRIIVGSDDSTVVLFDLSGKQVATSRHHTQPIVAVAGSHSGAFGATADSSGAVHIYSGMDLRHRLEVNLGDRVKGMTFSPSAQYLVVAVSEGYVAVVNVRTGRVDAKLRAQPDVTYACSGVDIDDNHDLVTSHVNGLLVLWSADQERPAIDLRLVSLTKPPSSGVQCPLCKRPMVTRERRTPPNTQFWGCPAFPRCRGTRNI